MKSLDYNSINFRNKDIDKMAGKFGNGDQPAPMKNQPEPKKTSTSFRNLQTTSSALKSNQNKPAATKSSAYKGLDEKSPSELKAASKKMGDRVVKSSEFDKQAYAVRKGILKGYGATDKEAHEFIKDGGIGSLVAREMDNRKKKK
jgi:hypothetical protein